MASAAPQTRPPVDPDRFLPIHPDACFRRGWTEVDVVLVTGDGYVDHPSFGTAVVGRLLEAEGYRVAILPCPDWKSGADFARFGRPRLFFGVTAGNIDSMVSNRTASRRRRERDVYAPGGKGGTRPDRATIVFTNRCKEAFPDVPVILGGLEASLRRLAHYDFWDDKVRRSILLDAKADLLVYGMGERQVVEIARRLAAGEKVAQLTGIRGTCVVRRREDLLDAPLTHRVIELPSADEIATSPDKMIEAQKAFEAEARVSGHTLLQPVAAGAARFVVQFPPAKPLSEEELDRVYALPYVREAHPVYDAAGGVPALEPVRWSVTSHRGCFADCSFCTLTLHQGKGIQSRSIGSVEREVEILAHDTRSHGRISDVGGPSANMYGMGCPKLRAGTFCLDRDCLLPTKCPFLEDGDMAYVRLLRGAREIEGVKKVGVGSGMRYDLLSDNKRALEEICAHHVSGQLKVAPEHVATGTLQVMNKPSWDHYEAFEEEYREVNKKLGRDQYLANYFITGHPGTRLEDAIALFADLLDRNYAPEQVQDFIPLPMTRAACMWVTGKDPRNGQPVHVPRADRERIWHRALAQWKDPRNRKYVEEALIAGGRPELIKRLPRLSTAGATPRWRHESAADEGDDMYE